MASEQTISNPRVVLLTSPSLYGAAIINTLARAQDLQLVGVGLTNRVYKNQGPLTTLIRLIRRSGFAYTWYNIVVSNVAWTSLRLKGRPSGLKLLPAKGVRYVRDINSVETRDWLSERSPDVIASFYFNQWIGPKVCEIPRNACVNLHPSRLPALRGPDPIFRTVEQGLTRTGITLHRIADEFDAGELLYQQECDVPTRDSLLNLYAALVERGAQILAEWLAGRLDNNRPEIPAEKDTYFGFPTAEEVRRFRRQGHRLGGILALRQACAKID